MSVRDTKIEMNNLTLRMGNLFEVEGAINITEKFYANALTEKEVNSKRKEEFKKKLNVIRDGIFFMKNRTSMPYGVFYTNKEKDNLVVVVGQIFQIKDDFDETMHPKYINKEGKEVEDEKLNIAKPKNRIYCYGSLDVTYWSGEIDFDTSALIYDDKIKRKVYLESATNPSIGRRRAIDTKMEEWLSLQGRYLQTIEEYANVSFKQEILDELMDKFRNYCISINPMADAWRYTRAYLQEDVFDDNDYYTDVDLLFTKEPKDKEGEKRAKELEDSLTKEQRKIYKKYRNEYGDEDYDKTNEWNNSKRVMDIKEEIYFLKKRNESLDLNTEPLDDEELKFIKTKYPLDESYIYIAISPTARCFFVLNHQLEFLLVDVKVDTYTQSTTLQDLVLQLI